MSLQINTIETPVQRLIKQECKSIERLLLIKNQKYGNSAINPRRLFSKASSVEQILVRIDDKLNRINTIGFEKADDGEDTVQDLIGYLILLRVAQQTEKIKEHYGRETTTLYETELQSDSYKDLTNPNSEYDL